MKRFFFTVIALSAVAVGCTKSGLLESPQTYQEAITFEPYTGKAPVTKATVADDQTLLGGFRVIGFAEGTDGPIADPTSPYLRKMVTGAESSSTTTDADGNETTSTTTDWSYEGAMFWPDNVDDKLSFVAYGLNVNGTPAVNKTAGADYGDVTTNTSDIFKMTGTDYTSFTYSVPDARTAQKDLIISPVNSGVNGRTVDLRLYHVLSRIGFSLTIENNTEVKPNVEITSITLSGNFISEATFNLANAVTVGTNNAVTYIVGGTPASKTYSFFATNESFTASSASDTPIYVSDENDRFMMLVPSDDLGDEAKITVKYSIGDIEQKDAVLSLADFQFKAGKAYEFVFTLSTVAVNFGVNVTDWNTTHSDASTEYPLN